MRYISKKQDAFIFSYGILILTYAFFYLFIKVAPLFTCIYIENYESFIDWIDRFFHISCIFLYGLPINFLIAYGVFRHRAWARYGVITVMLTLPIYILNKFLWWGGKSLDVQTIAIQVLVVSLTVFCFTRQPIIASFGEGEAFKLKNKTGAFSMIIVLFAFVPLIVSFGCKIFLYSKHDMPFFISKPNVITTGKRYNPELLTLFDKKELLNISLLIPKGFDKIEYEKSEGNNNELVAATLTDDSSNNIYLSNYSIFSSFCYLYRKATYIPEYLKSGFECEKYMITNNWNPMLLILNDYTGDSKKWNSIKEIYIDEKRGFLKLANKPNYIWAAFSLYTNDDTRAISGGVKLNKDHFNEDDIIAIISSVEFL